MSKVDEYTGNGMIVVSDGEVWAVDDSGLPDVIGEIGRVELSIEMPENLIGIYRVEHIMLFDEDDEELYGIPFRKSVSKSSCKKIRYFRGYYNCFIKDNIQPQKQHSLLGAVFVCKNKGGMIK